jgi:predicted DCC family thiol-disulfide oxidoreductase YuxK
MRNGWTGGQYSAFRVALGLYLAVHFGHLLPWGAEVFSSSGVLPDAAASPFIHAFPNLLGWADSPLVVSSLLGVGVGASLLLAAGWYDRAAAIVIWYVLACLFGRNPLIANPALPFAGWALLAHALVIPPAPYGSWGARGRLDPGGRWSYPPLLFGAAWVVMALAYTYSGATKLVSPSWTDGSALRNVLENPLARPTFLREWLLSLPPLVLTTATYSGLLLELLYAPLALVPKLRPWLWALMVGLHVGLVTLVDFADLSLGMLLFHAFTFDPAWIKGRDAASAPALVLYDGTCGFCQGWVRALIAEDRDGSAFRFSPLQGERAQTALGAAQRHAVGDSVVVITARGEVLSRSTAAVYLGSRLGGIWRMASMALLLVPRRLRDAAYDAVAGIRRRLAAARKDACPLLPAELRARFEA